MKSLGIKMFSAIVIISGAATFAYLTYAVQPVHTESPPVKNMSARDELTEYLLTSSGSDALEDIERDLVATELRDLSGELENLTKRAEKNRGL